MINLIQLLFFGLQARKIFTLLWTCLLFFTSLAQAQIVNIPDGNFRAALLNNHSIDTNNDGEIQVTEAGAYGGSIDVKEKNISDLTGIEAFVSLTGLNCSKNQLSTLDVSHCRSLLNLDCSDNQLLVLDVVNNVVLTSLNCSDNQLATLDVSQNPDLTHLYLSKNKVTALDISNSHALVHLDCSVNELVALDVSNSPALTHLECSINRIIELDVSHNPVLTNLWCYDNQIAILDINQNPQLDYLYCAANQLTALDVSKNPVLNILSCFSNQLTTLDVTENSILEKLNCSDNQLKALDLRNGNNHNMIEMNASSNSLSCILVDDASAPHTDWKKDAQTVYSETGDCLDTEPPNLTCPPNQVLTCGQTVPDYTVLSIVTDNHDPNPVIIQTPAIGSPVTDGMNITLTAKDASGNQKSCEFSIQIDGIPVVTIDKNKDISVDEGESIQLESRANEEGTFTWSPSEGLNRNDVADPIASPKATTTYTVMFTNRYGCEAMDEVTVTVNESGFHIPKGFSPDNDGINDTWIIKEITNYPENYVSIFNRWGNLIFEVQGYDNNQKVFSGRANRLTALGAKELPEGTYFYSIKLTSENEAITGYLVLKR